MTKDNTRYFVKYLDGQPMGTMQIQHELSGYDEEADGDFTYNGPLLPYQKEMCKVLIEQGWAETDFITNHDAHTQILNSVKKPGDDENDVGLWRRQGEEIQRREKLANCIKYVDLLNLAKKRLGMRYYAEDGKAVPVIHRGKGQL